MKCFKLLTFVIFVFALVPISKAQDLSNVNAIMADGYTISELHELCDILTLSNHRTTLEKRGFTFEKNDTENGSYIYKKNDYVNFYVNYEDGVLTSVHFKSSPQKFYKAIAEIKDNSNFTYSSEKASGTGKLIYYKHKGHSMSVNDNYYRVTMWPKEDTATSSTSTTTAAAPVAAPTAPIPSAAPEKYYSAKEVADVLNQYARWANIGFSKPNYEFETVGKMDMDKRSIRFIARDNVLYIQMNIPRNGECDYGLKEIKADWNGGTGGGSTQFYIAFHHDYTCDNVKYTNLYVTFLQNSSFTKDGVMAWIEKNAN